MHSSPATSTGSSITSHDGVSDYTPLTHLVRTGLFELAKRRPIFHSEADFQYELATQLTRLDSSVEIRLEWPVRVPGTRVINLDMLLRLNGLQYAVELKYITAKLDVTIGDEAFLLKSQAAQDLRRYDILKDILRVESLVETGVVGAGMSVTITNDRTLWRETLREGTVDEAFRLHHGRIVTGDLAWADHAAAGTIRGREAALSLASSYLLDWEDYSQLDAARNGEFRMLIVEVAGTVPSGN
ncbi:hypothetical protein [Leucobacter sp. VD1]|uniref:hypothetical protein n=1 Tax=Leucobacter sp. VD1 TaxID=3080381 RepID=UPI003019ECA0